MSRPDKCKWCGCDEVVTETLVMTAFRCFSSYWSDNQQWDLSEACAMKCAGQVLQLRQRMAAAVEALKTIDRYSIEGVYDFGAIGKYDKLGDWVHFEDLEAVVAILEGKGDDR